MGSSWALFGALWKPESGQVVSKTHFEAISSKTLIFTTSLNKCECHFFDPRIGLKIAPRLVQHGPKNRDDVWDLSILFSILRFDCRKRTAETVPRGPTSSRERPRTPSGVVVGRFGYVLDTFWIVWGSDLYHVGIVFGLLWGSIR